jgi:hypothetical protein
VLVPDIGQIRGIIDSVPDILFRNFNILKRLGDKTRLRFARRSSARMLRVNKFEGLSYTNEGD